jgi:hypothetical protein
MSKNNLYSFIIIAAITAGMYFILNRQFQNKVTDIKTQFESCMDNCDLFPYAVYLKKLEAFEKCKAKNDSLNALLRDCGHIVDEEARERCEEKNTLILEQIKPCYLPIPPHYQAYLECVASNADIRARLPKCLQYKPTYERCLEEYKEMESRLVNCEAILLEAEKEYRKCKARCNDYISTLDR